MSATPAMNIYAQGTTKDDLVDIKGKVIDEVAKATISTKIKNTFGVGDPAAGSVTYDRFKSAVSKDYGTAREAGSGDPIKNTGKVTNNIDDNQELVEEYENSDVKRFGIVDLIDRRHTSQSSSMARYLDRAYFTEAEAVGTGITGLINTTPIQDNLETVIQNVETVENDWVDGVDRSMIVLTVKPSIYGKLANYLNEIKNEITGETEVLFNGQVRIFSNHRQTKDIIAMAEGAVAQDVNVYDYDPARIPLSNAVEGSLFYDQGTEAVMPDLVFFADLEEPEVDEG
jgi:hypothetical protein